MLDKECPRTNNPIEGGVNAQLRRLLRYHRGMSVEKRIKAVFWWCYLHSPRPLSAKEILEVMPIDAVISYIYRSMNERAQLQGIIPTWGDAISWGDLHNYDKLSSMIGIKVPNTFCPITLITQCKSKLFIFEITWLLLVYSYICLTKKQIALRCLV